MTPDQAIQIVASKVRGRTRFEGQEPFLDEVLVGEIERLRTVLGECEEYFDQRADADHNGVSFIANDEMRLLTEIREVLPASHFERSDGGEKDA